MAPSRIVASWRILGSVLLILLAFVASARSQDVAPLRIATWNIANLHHQSGKPLRTGAVARMDSDYDRIASIIAGLSADIIALQEIGSPAALERIVSAEDYHLVISDRYISGDELRPPQERDIFTAVAISKLRFPELPKVSSVGAFSLTHFDFGRDGTSSERPTRAAIEIRFYFAGKEISFLGVHLKSSCHQFPLTTIEDQNFFSGKPFGSRYDCRTLKAQLAILENWIELRSEAGYLPIVAGDFNRRLNMVYRNPTRIEDFWRELNDGQPNGLELVKGPLGLDNVCWPNHNDRYDEHIDFIVADKKLVPLGQLPLYQKLGLGYDDAPEYAGDARQRLSDHCPVIMEIPG